uniref:Rap guanine nucleotide exchange factor 2 n=1 Tax=Schistosoma mansoni TaxID=6183 RepID=A0A5K4FE73_SCHMA
MDDEDSTFIRMLAIVPAHRSPQENALIFGYLRTIEGLNLSGPSSTYRDNELRAISRYARYRRVPGDMLLYHAGEWCDSWFILISGSVLIESSMFLPRSYFGTRTNGNFYRRNDCLVLEPSDLVIDYLDNYSLPISFTDTHRLAVAPYKHRYSLDRTPVSFNNNDNDTSREILSNDRYSESSHSISSSLKISSLLNPDQSKDHRQAIRSTQKADAINSLKSLYLSDTSSTHSFSSGGVQNDSSHGRSSHSFVLKSPEKLNKKIGYNYPKWYKTGSDNSHCMDSEGDDDDDDEEEEEEEVEDEELESSSHESIRDAFWESILKLPSDRTQEDVDLLLENVEQLPAFSNLTKATCRSLCSVMVLAIIREAGQIVLNDNEVLDTWSVVLNGTVEVIEPDDTIRELTRGDAFGVRLGKTDCIHHGVMRTVTEDCHFLCVPQTDYVKIMSREGEAEIPEMGEGGRVVLVYESINLDTTLNIDSNKSPNDNNSVLLKKCRLVTKGTPEKLIEHLIADLSNGDITYPEDFLLTYRTFLDSPRPIVDRLLSWHLHNPKLRSRVNRIILLWVHNHFNDFEDNHEMMKCIEKFDNMLSSDGTAGERRLFRLACSTKARPRQVELIIPLKSSCHLHPDNKSFGVDDGTGFLSSNGQHLNNNYDTINSLIDLPFTMIGGEDGFGVFIHQVYTLVSNNNSETSYDEHTNQKYLTNPSSLSLSSPCDSSYPPSSATRVLPNFSFVHDQIRRADQLLAVNGRSVEHLKPSDVIQLIHSMINACCPMNIKTRSNTKLVSGASGSLSPSTAHYSTGIDNETMMGHSKSSTLSSVISVTFNLRLLVIFNPVQYYQAIDSLNTTHTAQTSMTPINKTTNVYQIVDDLKTHVKKSTPSSNITLNNHDGNNEICRPKMHSLPTSISIPDDLVKKSNDPHQQSPSTVLLPKMPTPCSFSTASTLSTYPGNNSIGRCRKFQPSHVTSGRPSHSANTSPTRLSHSHEDSQVFYKTSMTVRNKQVTVESGPIVKQSRLSNVLDDLSGRLTLNSRYYLKSLHNHDPLIADDVAKSILAESRVTFTQLPPNELAARLTIDDYEIFRSVQSTEYIDEIFGLSNAYVNNISSSVIGNNGNSSNTGYATGHENLDRFTDLVNREAYWAPTEICNETNLNRRVDLLKRFIKLAKLCRELLNFNTMFCLLVGLHQTPVERLKQTWDRLPNKYQKIYRDLSMVLDTSRNFHHYRTLLSANNVSAPMLPYLPLVLKDLTFIHLGNPSCTPDGLVNFVKLRMLAKEVRSICRMCNVDYDLCTTAYHGRVAGGVGRARAGANLSALKAVASVSSINPKSYFSNLTTINNFSQTNHNNNNNASTDSNWSEHNMVERKFSYSNSLDYSEQQQRESTLNFDANHINPTNVSSGFNVGHKRLHQHGNPTTLSSESFNVELPTANSLIVPGGGIRRRSNLGLISSSINPKKIYESWLMTLRIRTYFANLRVVQDPELLSQLSSRIEPSGKDSKAVQPFVVSSVGITDTTTTTTTTNNNNNNNNNNNDNNNNNNPTNEGNGPQLNTSNLPPSNNNTKLKGIKLSPTKTSAQSVVVESNTKKKSPLKVINISTESSSVPPATVAASITSNPTDMFTRPLLGAQSVEDARKLLALSVGSKRSSQRRLPVFTFPNHFDYNNTHNVAQSLFITSPVRPYAGIGFGHLKSQHYNNSNVSSSIGSSYQVNNNTIMQMSNNSTSKPSSTTNATISTCSNHLHHHHYSHAQIIYPQPTRCYSTPIGTSGSKSLLLHNLIPIPSRLATNMKDSGNSNSTSNQMYAMLPNQRDPSHLHQQQHSLIHHQQTSASPPDNRGQSTMKHQYFSQATNQNTNHQYQQQPNPQSLSNFIGSRLTLNPNTAAVLHPSCRGISLQQQMTCPYRSTHLSGEGAYPPYQQQATVQSGHFREQSPSQQHQHSVSFNFDENYLYPTVNTLPLGGSMLSIPRNYRQSVIQRIIPQYLNCKPTRPPPYEIALALKYPQNVNSQRALKNDTINKRHENDNNSNNNNNYHTASNLSSGIKLGTVHTQVQNPKSDKQLFTVKQLSDKNSQNPINYASYTTTTATIVSSCSEFSNNNNNNNNNSDNNNSLQYERNKSSTVCQSFQQRMQERPSPPSYQQVLSMSRRGNNQGSLKIISAQSHPPSNIYSSHGRPQPPQRTMATLSSNCSHNNYRASSCSPGMTIVRPVVNDLNSVEPHHKHIGRLVD